jgi:hypothetical protein
MAPLPAVAGAFLALSDDGGPPSVGRRSLPRAAAALAAAVALAIATPMAWASAAPRSADKPAAIAASKTDLPGPDADDDAE